jgi:DNA-directed RNA polymerase specialized sigma24 family protein
MSTLAQDFEANWDREQDKLRRYFFRHGVGSSEIDDRLQDVAIELWRLYREGKAAENFSTYSMKVARYRLIDLRRAEARRGKLQYEPPEYFDEQTLPFADLWGRRVWDTRWGIAEEVSLAPLGLAEILAPLKPLIPRDYPILYYLSLGASRKEVSEFLHLPVPEVQYRITQFRRFLSGQLSAEALLKFNLRQREVITPPSPPAFPLQVQRLNTASYLRQLPGFVAEWILWFSRLSAYTSNTNKPITFGVIRRLARETGTLSEEQGRRFLLAATSHHGGLLTQKFFQIVPRGEPRLLSFSDISQLLRKESVVGDQATDSKWMDQIATAWEPTPKWGELTASG